MMLEIEHDLHLPSNELSFSFTRSSKPGGQNVNKVNTRVTLFFNVAGSTALTYEQKKLIFEHLATRISKKGVLHVVSYRYRTQTANRKAAIERFVELLQSALQIETPRIKTKIPKRAKRLRLAAKKHRGKIKDLRRSRKDFDDQ
jgi:ribosome-associated protein